MLKFLQKHIDKQVIFLISLGLIFFYQIVIHPEQMMASSDLKMYSGWKLFFHDYLAAYNKIPLWNPYLFGGSSYIGNAQTEIFYPLNFLYLVFLPDHVFGYMFLFDVLVLGISTYYFSKIIQLSSFASFFSAVTIMFSPILLARLYPGHIFIFDAFIWLPFLFLFYELLIKKRKLIFALTAGGITGIMLLTGMGQIALYNIVASSLFFIYRVFHEYLQNSSFPIKKMLVFYIASLFLGFSLAAIQLLPIIEFSQISSRARGVSYDFATSYSFHPYYFITSVLPHFFGSIDVTTYWGKGNFWEVCGYIGIIPLLLVLISLFKIRNRYVLFFFFLSVFSLLIAMGKYTPFYSLLYNFFPGFNLFRAPARFLLIYSFSTAILSGIGLDLLLKSNNNYSFKLFFMYVVNITLVLFSFILSIFNINLLQFLAKTNQYSKYFVYIDISKLNSLVKKDTIILAFISFTFILFLYLRIQKYISIKTFKLVLVLLVVCDLWIFSNNFVKVQKPDVFFNSPRVLEEIKKDAGLFRVFDFNGKVIETGARKNIQNLVGYDPIYLKDYRDFLWLTGKHENTPLENFFQFASLKHITPLRMLNTKYIISKNDLYIPEFQPKVIDGFYLYTLSDTLPRAYIVPNARIIQSKEKLLKELNNNAFDPKKEVLFLTNELNPLSNESPYQEVPISSYQPDAIKLLVKLENPGYLVLSENWYPGWKATDNGKDIKILKGDFLFRTLYLSKGYHTVTFLYDPLSYKIGKSITIATLVIFFGISVFILKPYKLKFG